MGAANLGTGPIVGVTYVAWLPADDDRPAPDG
jgi:hypothetical protein